MENQKPTYPTTQENRPLETPPSPPNTMNIGPKTSYPTPRFMSKRMAIIFLGIIALIFLSSAGAYFLGKNSTNQSVTVPSPTPVAYETPTPTPAQDETANWKTYNWLYQDKSFFSIKYPEEWDMFEYEKLAAYFFPKGFDYNNLDGKTTYVGVAAVGSNPEDCTGDCPIIETKSDTQVSGLKARKLEGYIGSVGGNIPKRFEEVVIKKNDSYINIIIYGKDLNDISQGDKEILSQMLSTFKFTQ